MNKMAKNITLALILLSAVSFAVIVDASDAAKDWASNTASVKCGEPNVDSAYICSGNVVRVVSSLDGGGSTYYRQDGKVTRCPLVAPSATSAECQMFSTPNYCSNTPVCRGSTPPAQPQTNGTSANNTTTTPTVPVQNVTPPAQPTANQTAQPPILPEQPTNTPPVPKTPVTQGTGAQNPVDNLLLIVVGLGLVSIVVLFTLFRNTLKE